MTAVCARAGFQIVGAGGDGNDMLPRLPNLQTTLSNILARSQDFMRKQEVETIDLRLYVLGLSSFYDSFFLLCHGCSLL